MKKIAFTALALLFVGITTAQEMKPFELSSEWLTKIEELAPEKTGSVDEQKNILIFSLYTGFEHWAIPHTEAVIKTIAEKYGSFKVISSNDIAMFQKNNLKKFDAVVLNNNCSDREKRDLFWDKLGEDASLTEEERTKEALQLENNLLDYVKNGGGLMVLHGAIVMQNKSEAFGKMLGGSFDYHPKQQKIQVKLVDPAHPLVAAFSSGGFEHVDEPYFFNNAYFDYNFKPLLYMETDKLEGLKEEVKDKIKYISWIKKYGAGKVFYCSPSHNAQSYENAELLLYLLNGLQYVVGDLEVDDSPTQAKGNEKEYSHKGKR